jgi:hypothetical protein
MMIRQTYLKLGCVDLRNFIPDVGSRLLEGWRRVQVPVLECIEVEYTGDGIDDIVLQRLVERERLQAREGIIGRDEREARDLRARIRSRRGAEGWDRKAESCRKQCEGVSASDHPVRGLGTWATSWCSWSRTSVVQRVCILVFKHLVRKPRPLTICSIRLPEITGAY